MYATDWAAQGFAVAPFVGGVTLSGVHDLAPLVLFTHNADLRLDDAVNPEWRPTFVLRGLKRLPASW